MIYIEPVECALAVIGIEAVISKEVEKVLLSDVKEMEGLTKWVYSEAKLIVNGQVGDVPLTAVNYKKMLGWLTDGYDAGQLEEMVSKFPLALQDISGEFLIKANQVVTMLRGMFPVQTKQTLLGPENISPPALAIRKFATLLDVLDDPKRVLSHISCGSLLKSQAAIVKTVYPTFSECVSDAFSEAGTSAKAAKKSFTLPGLAEIGYGTWAGLPRVSPQLQSKLQANFAKQAEEKPKPAGQEGTSSSVVAKEALTSTQRGLYPQAATKG